MSGVVQFETELFGVSETIGTFFIPILRTGDLSQPVVVEYDIGWDAATPGVDFVASSGFVSILAGESRALIEVRILDDALPEATEAIFATLVNISSGALQGSRTVRVDILDNENPVTPDPEPPRVSDYDVTTTVVVNGLVQPISFEFRPDGRMYVAEKAGIVKLVNPATGASSVVLDIQDIVNNNQDRGLMDIALHPDFPASPYLYAFYVVDPPETAGLTGNAEPDGAGNRFSHLMRYELDAATGYATVKEGGAVLLMGGAGQSLSDISGGGVIDSTTDVTAPESGRDPVTGEFVNDYLKVDARSHAGGSLAFGPDGMLYVSTGDGTSYNRASVASLSVQDVDSLAGKILRIDPITGRGLSDNPFVDPNGSLDDNSAKVWQLGLRNPFAMGFAPDGALFISDTGWSAFEEVNSGRAGTNFGWPLFEGGDNGQLVRARVYTSMPEAQALYAEVAAGTRVISPAYRAFARDIAAPGFDFQAIVGGDDVYTGDRYPSTFKNDYFFTDFSRGHIYSIDVNDARDVKYLMDYDGPVGPVHFQQGPDGFVYIADLVRGQIRRIVIEDIAGPPSEQAVTLRIAGTGGPTSPAFRVLANGEVIGTGAVSDPQTRAERLANGLEYRDYSFDVDADLRIDKLEVVYFNDAIDRISGENLNLYVDYVDFGGRRYQSETDGFFTPVAAAPGRAGPREDLLWSGTLAFDAYDTIVVRAGGQGGPTLSPAFRLVVDGVVIATQTISDPQTRVERIENGVAYTDYSFTFRDPGLMERVEVVYFNDGADPVSGEGLNLYVDRITANGVVLQSEVDGFYTPLLNLPGRAGPREDMLWSGSLAFDINPPTVQPGLVVRAGGQGVPTLRPAFRVLVDGVELAESQIGTPQTRASILSDGVRYTDFVYEFTPSASTDRIEIVYFNDATDPVSGESLNLYVDRIEIDGTRFEAERDGFFTPVNAGPGRAGPREDLLWSGTLAFDLPDGLFA